MTDLQMRDNTDLRHYEARDETGVVAFIEYRQSGSARLLTHTEVNEAMEGKGVGSDLVRYALEDIKARGERVVPMCPFVAAFMQRHREYTDLVDPRQRGMFGL
jgi:uncharacterized protein